MPVKRPRPQTKKDDQPSITLITIAVILAAWVGLISIAEPKGQVWAALTAPFR